MASNAHEARRLEHVRDDLLREVGTDLVVGEHARTVRPLGDRAVEDHDEAAQDLPPEPAPLHGGPAHANRCASRRGCATLAIP